MHVRIALLLAIIIVAGCSSGSAPTGPSPPTTQNPPGTPGPPAPPAGPPTITISATGISPREVTVAVGGRVLFVNGDTRAHELWGGADHDHRDCPDVDVVGFLVPGQSRETGTFSVARTCDFHDHTNLGNPAYQGRILVQ